MKVLRIAELGLFALAACAAATSPTTRPASEWKASAIPAAATTAALGSDDSEVPADAGTRTVKVLNPVDAGEVDGAISSASACNDQAPQDFLIRSNFLKTPDGNQRAIQYRTDTYGYFHGFGRPPPDAHAPNTYVVGTTFMGLPVRMHNKVVPALRCVEQEIQLACKEHPYTARALAGVRFNNTYRRGEVTNHIYGIAIDIDPGVNPCCGCVKPWSNSPLCQHATKTEYDRMAMPECWVHAFERFGFYWLGHDVLRDTMHFEFLGDPGRVLKVAESPDGIVPSSR